NLLPALRPTASSAPPCWDRAPRLCRGSRRRPAGPAAGAAGPSRHRARPRSHSDGLRLPRLPRAPRWPRVRAAGAPRRPGARFVQQCSRRPRAPCYATRGGRARYDRRVSHAAALVDEIASELDTWPGVRIERRPDGTVLASYDRVELGVLNRDLGVAELRF